jgi:hypothetical protein
MSRRRPVWSYNASRQPDHTQPASSAEQNAEMSGHDTKRGVCHAPTTGKRTVRLLYAVVGDSLHMCFGGPRACGSMACSGHATVTIGLMHALFRIGARAKSSGLSN